MVGWVGRWGLGILLGLFSLVLAGVPGGKRWCWRLIPLVLLLWPPSHASLMAHDEGYYALQARWILTSGDWITPQWWGEPLFDRTIGLQWLIALSFQTFGMGEWSARLPSLVAAGVSVLLLYRLGWGLGLGWAGELGALILPLMGLWIHYAHLATQDLCLVAVELAGMTALVEAEGTPLQSRARGGWLILAGSLVGVGFLIKGVMIGVAVLALLPVVILGGHWRHPGLYGGAGLGFLPVVAWLGTAVHRYGWDPLRQLLGKVLVLSQSEWHQGNGLFYYFWNIPVNSFPWFFLAVGGIGILLGSPLRRRLYLLVYPGLMLLILTLFRTRTPYYALQLYPWIALLAGVGLEHLLKVYQQGMRPRWGLALGILGGVGILAGVLPWFIAALSPYRLVLGWVGGGWLGLAVLWHWRGCPPGVWLALWFVPLWLGIGLALDQGLLSDFSPQIKAQVMAQIEHGILKTPVDFVVADPPLGEDHKTWILLGFYTPVLGERVSAWQSLKPGSLAWFSPGSPVPAAVITDVAGWQLAVIPAMPSQTR